VEKLPCGWGHHQRLNCWSSWTSHTMPQPHSHWLPDHQPPKRSKPLSRNPLPASHIGTHTPKMAGRKAVYSWHTYCPQKAVYATNFETSCCCASHHDAQWCIHDAP
jgi:hypothetical protein